jgi:hypothetical protein
MGRRFRRSGADRRGGIEPLAGLLVRAFDLVLRVLPFSLFALFISFLLLVPLTLAWRLAAPALSAALQQRLVTFADVAAALALPLAIGLYARAVGPTVAAASRENPIFSIASPLPQSETEITRILNRKSNLMRTSHFAAASR